MADTDFLLSLRSLDFFFFLFYKHFNKKRTKCTAGSVMEVVVLNPTENEI